MPRAPADSNVKVTITFAGEDLRRLREHQEREGFASLQAAAKALVFVGLEDYPDVAITREARLAVIQEFRMKMLGKLMGFFQEASAEVRAEASTEKDIEAVGASAQQEVVFSRENQG